MYRCLECKKVFDEPEEEYEDCTPLGAYEGGSFVQTYSYCPYCGGDYDFNYGEELEDEE